MSETADTDKDVFVRQDQCIQGNIEGKESHIISNQGFTHERGNRRGKQKEQAGQGAAHEKMHPRKICPYRLPVLSLTH